MKTVVYLLRHAESTPAPQVPFAAYPLSAAGERQARELVARLSALGIDHLHSSPWPRALATVAPFAASAGFEPRLDPRLVERHMGDAWLADWEGEVRRSFADPSYRPASGAESLTECHVRTAAAVEEIVARGPGRTHLLSMHGQNLVLALRCAIPDAGFAEWRALRFADLRRIEHEDGRFRFRPDAPSR